MAMRHDADRISAAVLRSSCRDAVGCPAVNCSYASMFVCSPFFALVQTRGSLQTDKQSPLTVSRSWGKE